MAGSQRSFSRKLDSTVVHFVSFYLLASFTRAYRFYTVPTSAESIAQLESRSGSLKDKGHQDVAHQGKSHDRSYPGNPDQAWGTVPEPGTQRRRWPQGRKFSSRYVGLCEGVLHANSGRLSSWETVEWERQV